MSEKILVIGGGLGGLSAAISLRAQGHQVTLLEKNSHLGGKLNILRKEGYSFDMGPSIFSLPQYFDELFARAGKKRQDYFTLQRVSPYWRNFFEDGTVVDLYQEDELMRKELDKLAPQAWEQYLAFKKYAEKNLDIVERGYFRAGLDTLWQMIRFYGLGTLMFRLDSIHTMDSSVRRFFSEPHLIDIFDYFIKYVGSSALRAPGFMNLMPAIHTRHDLWYVEGGMFNLSHALEKLAREIGIEIHTDCEVKEITHHNSLVTGVRFQDGSERQADRVVCNMEAIPAYRNLLHESETFLRPLEKRFEPACSGLVIHLGTKRIYPQLAHHNFVYSNDQRKHFQTVFEKRQLPSDPTLYVVAPTRTDASQAPAGKDNIKILPHIPHLNDQHTYTQDDYLQLRDRCIAKLERIGLTDLSKNIEVEHVWTPYDIQAQYHSNRGSIYGVVSDRDLNRGFKFPKRSSKYNKLYFVGGSVNPGGGMPMVVLCGQKVADAIAEDIAHEH